MRAKTKKRLVILMAAAVLLGAGLVAAYFVNERAIAARTQQYLADGLAAIEADDRAAVLHNLGMYIQRSDTRDVNVLLEYAKARAAIEMPGRQHLIDAIKTFRLVQDIEPDNPEAKQELLGLYWRVGRGVESLELADEFLAKNPNDGNALWVRAVSLQRLRRFDEAVVAADRFARVADNDYAYFMTLDIMQQRDDRPEDIVAHALKLHRERPDDPRFELLVGYAYTLANDRANAEKWLRQAADRDIHSVVMLRILAYQLDRMGMFDESMALLTKAARAGNDPAVRRELARRLWEKHDLPATLKELADVQASDGSDAELMALKALSLLQLDRRDEARPYLDAVAAVSGQAAARAWAIYLREAARSDVDARRLANVCRDALQHDARNATIRFSLAAAYEMLGESELAIEEWTKCKNERPGWHEPLVRIAHVYAATGRTQQAVEAAAEASTRAPNDADVIIAWVVATASDLERLSHKDVDELLQVIDEIQAAIPGEPRTLFAACQVRARFRGPAQAADAIRNALALQPPLDDEDLLRLARLSSEYQLGLEQACFDAAIEAHGMTEELALAQAIAMHDDGQTDAGRQAILQIAAQVPADQQVAYHLAEARYLDAIGHPDALAAWTQLVNDHPDHIAVHRMALASPTVASDRPLLDRTIDRLKKLTGDTSISWRLARARYLLDSDDRDRDAAIAASMLTDLEKTAPNSIERLLLLAEAMDKLRNPSGAIDRLSQAADRDPDSPQIALELADRLIRVRNDTARAKMYLERVLTSKSATPAHRRQAAGVLVQIGEIDRAVALLEEEVKRSNEPDLLFATLCWRQGRLADVHAMCERMLEEPNAQRIAFVADFFESIGHADQARAALAMLDSAGVSTAERELVLGHFHRDHGSPSDALAHYRLALETTPRSETAWDSCLSVLIMTAPAAEIGAAIADARKALPNSPDLAALATQWATVAELRGELPDHLRPVLLSVLDAPEHRDAAAQTLRLFVRDASDDHQVEAFLLQLRGLADRFPLYWPVQHLAVQLLMESGQHDDAIKIATRAAKAMPASADAAWLATHTLAGAGRWSEALVAAQDWRRRAYRDPSGADITIAEARIRLGDPGRAIAQLDPYIAEAIKQPDAFEPIITQYAKALIAARQIPRAHAMLRPLIGDSAAWRATWIELASTAMVDRAAAESWLSEAASLVPPDADDERIELATAWFSLSRKWNEPSYRGKVRQVLQPLASRQPMPAAVCELLAFCAELDGDLPAAERHYRQAIEQDPSAATAMNNLAMLLLTRRQGGDEASKLAARASALQPTNPTYQHTHALTLGAMGRHDEAIEAMRRAAKLDPGSVEWPLSLAEMLVEAGRRDQALLALGEVDQLVGRGAAMDSEQRQRLAKVRQAVTASGQTVSGM